MGTTRSLHHLVLVGDSFIRGNFSPYREIETLEKEHSVLEALTFQLFNCNYCLASNPLQSTDNSFPYFTERTASESVL